MSKKRNLQAEHWGSNLGVILAVAGSAVGFGNFLRFPGLAAQHGGGAFMIAYFCSLLLVGIPLSWVEWSVGRRGGALGEHSSSSIFFALTKSKIWKYVGLLGVCSPLIIAFYYLFLESWTLGYAFETGIGNLHLDKSVDYQKHFADFVGIQADGSAFDTGKSLFIWFFGAALLINFWFLARGITKGIEFFCKISFPLLLILSLMILVRVLTMGTPDPAFPDRNVDNGLGYMWNPSKIVLQENIAPAASEANWQDINMINGLDTHALAEVQRTVETSNGKLRIEEISIIHGLLSPSVWLAAAGQIFWSLSVGFGSIATYASYVRKKDDIALSSLSANAANEFFEVGIAGMMIVPAAVAFLGVVGAAGQSIFGLGFNILPQVFAQMPGGQIFGCAFFILLFLAAVTSSPSLIQPSIAFLEEQWKLSRSQSIVCIGALTATGASLVAWFSEDLIGLETFDFWFGTMGLYLLASVFLFIFLFKVGVPASIAELKRGALIQIPRAFPFIVKYITPSILLVIFCSWLYENVFIQRCDALNNLLNGEPGAWACMCFALLCFLFLGFVSLTSRKKIKKISSSL